MIPVSTSSAQAKRGLTAVFLPQSVGSLTHDSVALCHQITTLDRAKLQEKIGDLSNDDMKRIEEGLKAAVSLL